MANSASLVRYARLSGVGWRRGTLVQGKNGRIKPNAVLCGGVEYTVEPDNGVFQIRQSKNGKSIYTNCGTDLETALARLSQIQAKASWAREHLRSRFEACYPFHPATLSVFHRKWQSLRQFQQTRGALAMFAQWISYVYKDSHVKARNEPLITIGSAPLESPSFRAAVLGQLGESRLDFMHCSGKDWGSHQFR